MACWGQVCDCLSFLEIHMGHLKPIKPVFFFFLSFVIILPDLSSRKQCSTWLACTVTLPAHESVYCYCLSAFLLPIPLPSFSEKKEVLLLIGAQKQGRLLSAQARKSVQFCFVLGIFDEHAVFGEVEFEILNFKGKAFINRSSTCQVEHFAIKKNSIWRHQLV